MSARPVLVALAAVVFLPGPGRGGAQEASVKPGINDSFANPDPGEFTERFEKEGREVYDARERIVGVLALREGMAVADVGAGTGLFSRLLAPRVGPAGRLHVVDIAKSFVDHTVLSCRVRGWDHVEGVVCTADDVRLPPDSVDLVFLCDTYHHFEFPFKTLASIHRALRPGGRLVVVDFERIEGASSEWILGHVRAGKDVVRREIEGSGFVFEDEPLDLSENYVMRFRKGGRGNGG
jgi:ubiquinone/menaquinone biosynthesis C-methylase UbiE